MPKRILSLLAMLLCLTAAADSVRRLEVFIDTDPGPGNGTPITIPANLQADTVLRSFSYTLPLNLTPGRHTIYVRALADTAGNMPRWSLAERREFIVPELVNAAEYFFDTDPGPGGGTAITIATPADTLSFTSAIATNGLSVGKHRLYIRTRTNAGRWGLPQMREFYVTPVITAAEYFFDTDPGVGAGTPLAIATPADTVNLSAGIVTPAGLSAGTHRLYLRTRANGAWALTQVRSFEVLPVLTAAEYFFDTDPGPGNGTAITVNRTADTVELATGISTAGLTPGPHRLYLRSRSSGERWGLSAGRDFYVVPQILAAEYFWDTDPGIGNGVSVPVPIPGDTVSLNNSIKAPCLTPGMHHLYVRTKDQTGRWALSQEDTVIFSNPSILANLSYPGPGPYGTPVKVTGSGGTGPYAFALNSGAATADSIFLPANGASVVFTATDSCGYSGTANLTTPSSPVIIAGGNGGSGTVDLAGYRHWAWVLNGSGQIIAAVKDNGQQLGTVSVDYLKNNSGTVRQFPGSNIRYLDRNWLINPAIAPTAMVGVQLYAVDSEYAALAAVDASLTSKSSLRVQKYDGPNEDLSAANNTGAGASLVQLTPDSVVSFTGPAAAGNGYALAFSVSGFSEFYQSRAAAVPLASAPLELQLRRTATGVQLNWSTRGVPDIRSQSLERGREPQQLTQLAPVPVNGAESYTDRQPLDGMNYYRIQALTTDGRELYSNTVSIRIIGERMISVYPNPARDVLSVDGLNTGDVINLYDAAGRKLLESQANARIDLRSLASGMYLLRIHLVDGETLQQRVEVVR